MVWEGIQALGFQDIPKMPLSQAYGVCVTKCVLTGISVHLNLCVPHPAKHRKVPKTTTKLSVFALVWEGIQTSWISFGFQTLWYDWMAGVQACL